MIEAQALYIQALITKVKAAKSAGTSIAIRPKASVAQQYNNEIQARLSQSAFADPNCNSWYKNEAGLITNNWADAVIPYQKRTSKISWDEYDFSGPGAEEFNRQGSLSWKRVVEETQVSNTAILTGLVLSAGAVTAGALYRKSLKGALKAAA
jgi:hypothetical protein